jgi:hypothetical protein
VKTTQICSREYFPEVTYAFFHTEKFLKRKGGGALVEKVTPAQKVLLKTKCFLQKRKN